MFCSFVCLFFVTTSVNAGAKNGWYVGAGAGGAFVPDSDWKKIDGTNGESQFENGFIVNAALGYKFGMPRIEAEISYLTNDYDKFVTNAGTNYNVTGDISATTFLINGYLDFENKSMLTPFIFGGIGMSNLEAEATATDGTRIYDDDETVFAYQAGAGVSIQANASISIDLKYSYLGTGDADFTDLTDNTTVENEFGSHNILIGIRYSF